MQFIREIREHKAGLALEVVSENRFHVDKKGSIHGGGYSRQHWLVFSDVTTQEWLNGGYDCLKGKLAPKSVKNLDGFSD